MLNEGEELAATAHILRRTGFGAYPGRVRAVLAEHGSASKVLDAVIAAGPKPFVAPPRIDEPFDVDFAPLGNNELQRAWLTRMMSDDAGLHEKMMWFWHSHFTSGLTKAAGLYCWRQLRLFHQHAMGNFAELTKAICIDGAMLSWLDGGGSQVNDPNENFARELMELFTLGRDHYTELDVRASARAMAGWSLRPDVAYPIFNPAASLHIPVTFMGRTEVFTPDTIVDRILEQDAAAPFIVAKLARYFIGPEVAQSDIDAWAGQFRSSGYEIAPVVESIVRSDAFAAARLGRAQRGIEWLCTVLRAGGIAIPDDYVVMDFAQMPYQPPSVAGWPDRWLTTSSFYARAAFLQAAVFADDPVGDLGDDPVTAVLEHCGLFEVSDPTRAALAKVVKAAPDDQIRLLRAALVSPEFMLA